MAPTDTPRHFTGAYAEHVTLLDGTPVTLRLVRPDDATLLAAGFERMSAQSRYTRFMAPKVRLTPDELRYLTEVDHERHFALGATRDGADDAHAGLGVARFIRLPDEPATAEAAVAVADDAQGRGLGRLLFLRLCAAARERGVERFRCEVLGSNTSMRTLIESITPDREIEVESGVMSIEMQIPEVTPDEPVAGPSPDNSMYRLFKAAAKNAVEWTESVRRLWRSE